MSINKNSPGSPFSFPWPAIQTTLPSARHASDSDSGYVLSPLFPDHKVGLLLKYWFDELEIFYPCINRSDFYSRLSSFFVETCSSQGKMTRIPLQPEHISLAALTCGMLSLATYLGGTAEPHQRKQGDDYYISASVSWHVESRRLLDQLPSWREEPNLDILRLHLLEVLYMTILERNGGTSNAIAIAVDLAFAMQLHDESEWKSCSVREQEYRRLLWYTVCYMDQRVALKVGRPILIREADFTVGDFTFESREQYFTENVTGEAGNDSLPLRWPLPAKPTEDWFEYLLFRVRWGKIVMGLWDSLFSPRVAKTPDPAKIARADVLLTELQKGLPPSLVWDPTQLPAVMGMGDADRAFRSRLIIFEVKEPIAFFQTPSLPRATSHPDNHLSRPSTCFACPSDPAP